MIDWSEIIPIARNRMKSGISCLTWEMDTLIVFPLELVFLAKILS